MAHEEGTCKGCGAEWVGHAGAFACGYPLADCGAMIDAREEALADFALLQAEAQAFESMLADVVRNGTPEDVLAMDELEEELGARFEARFPKVEVAAPQALVDYKYDYEEGDIPF
jgi:hypothetical protein